MGTMTREQFIREVGVTPEQVGQDLRDFDRTVTYYCEHQQELRAGFPDRWIALQDAALVADAATLDELKATLDAKNVRRSGLLVRFLAQEEPILILPCR